MVRSVPPWNEGGPSLRVGWDPLRGEFILRAPGGHIIGTTSDPEEVLEAIRFESEWGFGAMEMRLQGCATCNGSHGLRSRPVLAIRTGRKRTAGPPLTLEDLGL